MSVLHFISVLNILNRSNNNIYIYSTENKEYISFPNLKYLIEYINNSRYYNKNTYIFKKEYRFYSFDNGSIIYYYSLYLSDQQSLILTEEIFNKLDFEIKEYYGIVKISLK